jgi:hypothetical protein
MGYKLWSKHKGCIIGEVTLSPLGERDEWGNFSIFAHSVKSV